MEWKVKTLVAVGGVAALAVSALAGAGLADDSNTVKAMEEKVASLNQNISSLESSMLVKDNLIAELQNAEPEVVEITTVNPVNEELLQAFDFLVEFPEYSEAIYEDLDDGEGALIPERIVELKNSLKIAVDFLDKEFADELDKETVNGTVVDEDDVERHKIYDELDEVELVDWEWEDNKLVEATWKIKNRFDHDDVEDLVVYSIVDIEDGKVDDIDFEE